MRCGSVKASRANRWNLWVNAGSGGVGLPPFVIPGRERQRANPESSGDREPVWIPGPRLSGASRNDSVEMVFLDYRLRGNERRLGPAREPVWIPGSRTLFAPRNDG